MKIAGLLVVALAGSVASAKIYDTSAAALNTGSFGDRAQGAWTTSFEAPTFNLGIMDNQNGWPVSGTNLPFATVSNANPQDGAQHVRTVNDPTVPSGTNRFVFSPSVVTPANTPDVTSWWVYISAAGGADYDYVGQAPSQGFLSWRVKLNFQGNIFVLDDEGEGLTFSDTGAQFPIGGWFQLAVAMDANANAGLGSVQYYLNGNLIHTSATGTVAGTSVEQFLAVNDNFQNPGEFADLDNIGSTIIPAPGALALVGLGGLVAGRRRRA
ncbi:MAG: PEP-CTERM sorting domain-containing protein [Phycisphaerales bacterium]